MHDADAEDAPRSVTSIWPAVVLLGVALAAWLTTRGYSPTSGRFPGMVAAAMMVLVLFDIWSRTSLPGARIVETFGGTSFRRREMMHNPAFLNQLECVGWIVLAFALMAGVGILAASPIFCAAFVRLRGKRTLAVAGVVGLLVLGFQVAVFEWALDYELYRGLPFTKGGLKAW